MAGKEITEVAAFSSAPAAFREKRDRRTSRFAKLKSMLSAFRLSVCFIYVMPKTGFRSLRPCAEACRIGETAHGTFENRNCPKIEPFRPSVSECPERQRPPRVIAEWPGRAFQLTRREIGSVAASRVGRDASTAAQSPVPEDAANNDVPVARVRFVRVGRGGYEAAAEQGAVFQEASLWPN